MESTFASRVKQFRQLKSLSQQAFAEQCDLAQGNIAHMESGTEPKQSNVSKLIAGFPDLNPDWLLNGTGSMLRDGRALAQLPPPVPSKLEEQPRPGYFRVTADNEELKQVKDERDNLRVQVNRLLDLLANSYGVPAAVGKAEASADAATSIYATVDRLRVDGLKRYQRPEEMDEAAHYDLATGQRRRAA